MQVLVAGATGFIGRACCLALVAAGHEVRGLVRDREKAASLDRDGITPVIGSLDAPSSFATQAGSPEAIVHLAATWFPGRETIEEARAIGARLRGWTEALARLARDSGTRTFVFCGSAGPRREVVGYDRILDPSQRYLLEEHPGLPVTVVVPGWVYGAGSWFPVLAREIPTGRTAHLVEGGGARLGYVHVEDVGEAFRLAVERGAPGGFYNVVDDERLEARQFVEATARAIGAPMPRGLGLKEAVETRGEVYAEALTCPAGLDTRSTRDGLGWRPRFPTSREGLPAALGALGL